MTRPAAMHAARIDQIGTVLAMIDEPLKSFVADALAVAPEALSGVPCRRLNRVLYRVPCRDLKVDDRCPVCALRYHLRAIDLIIEAANA